MALTSWLNALQQAAGFHRKPQPRRRSSMRVDLQFPSSPEQFEERTLLSAAPVVDLALLGPVNYTEGSGAIVIAPAASVTDLDSLTFDGGNLTASLAANADVTDRLSINNQGMAAGQIGVSGATVSYGGTDIGTLTGGTGATPQVVTFNANATVAAVQALQENITFQIIGDSAVTAPRTFETVITDAAGGNASLPATATINVLEAVPVITLSTTDLTVTNSSPKVLDAGIVITTAGAGSLDGAVLTVSLTNGTSRDFLGVLNFGLSHQQIRVSHGHLRLHGTDIGTISGGTATTPLTITFNANATLADVQQVARSITFRSIGHATHETAAVFQFNDGQGGVGQSASLAIHVTRGGNSHHGKPDNPGNGNPGHGNPGHGNPHH
ncbi:MAG: hypothetical protein JWN70_6801 [Planctomycetaceae bacterium]|nr:hypothetical protein [Planctomycetaceae bacterium]